MMRQFSAAWLNKVNSRLLLKRHKTYSQFELNEPQLNTLYPLETRKLLRVTGPDASIFLQGLITNDMRHFDDGAKSMYAMFLNNKGRVLYDTLIHKSEDHFLLECDKNVVALLLRHLKMFKLRRQVELGDFSNHYKLWAFTAPPEVLSKVKDIENRILIYKDPRIESLGYRVLSHVSVQDDSVQRLFGDEVTMGDETGYRKLRYQLGVSEGSYDLPPGTCFPLEANCDYLHGVSFHKGCYVGQELTARVHHTGVVRKRIMPLQLSGDVIDLEVDATITASTKPKSNLGKIKGFVDNCGLGLVRIKEALEAKDLIIGQYTIKIEKPSWWPLEAPKDKNILAD